MRSALLLGRQHTRIAALATEAEGPAAITLSRGGALKTYAHHEPNEDAALFALGQGGWLAAVADGHHGARGAQTVLEHLLDRWAPRWTGAQPLLGDAAGSNWAEFALDALLDCNRAILECAGREAAPVEPTTLSLALVRPQEDRWCWLCMGDSPLFRADARGVHELGWASLGRERTYFLGYAMERSRIGNPGERHLAGCEPLAGVRALVLTTDGLSEPGIGVDDPSAAVAQALVRADSAPAELAPLEIARHLSQIALEAQRRQRAGDNLACAVLRTEQTTP